MAGTKKGAGAQAPAAMRTYVAETKDQEARDDRERRADYATCFRYALDHDRLEGATLVLPPCGCNVTGRGTLRFPIRIRFCETHARAGS